MKILSPAGECESLKMAVYNGADEVYLGVKDFNARNIEGFDLNSLKQAVEFAHVFDVKIFLAVNILFSDEEMQSALDLVVDAYNFGVDAFIIQDIGLISLINKHYPQIEIHASTQMGLHNLEGVKVVERLGVKRVVLARETSLNEIKRIKENSNVEIEYFVHGALCVSFSGNCYLSSYLNNASGNRGKCKQLCRLPYDLCFDGKTIKSGYLLSAKDFNMLNRLNDLQEVGVDSLKIEGRARRPYYVAEITKAYRNALNNIKTDESNIKLAFNRGYTEGYFNGNGNIISNKQNHIGIEVGKVEKVKLGKKFNEIFISSNREISAKSVLKYINKNEEVVLTAFDIQKSNNLYRITTTQKVQVGASVYLISDFEKEQALLNKKIKRKIEISISAKENFPITAEFNLNNEKFIVKGEICVKANNQPITLNDLITNFNKSDLFEVELNCNLENVFLPKQKLNEFRRKVFEKVKNICLNMNRDILTKVNINKPKTQSFPLNNYQFVENLNNKFLEENIIYSPKTYNVEDVLKFKNICEENNKKAILDLPNFATQKDIELIKDIIAKTNITILINNLYALDFDADKIVGGGLNVFNNYTANYFGLPYIKAEDGNFKMPYMTLKHCPIKQHCDCDCSNCKYKDGYYFKMPNGKKLYLKRKRLTECTFYLTD